MKFIMPALFALAAISIPAQAEEAKDDLPPAKQDKSKMVCKRFTELGSRLTAKKVCKTEKEWDEARGENQKAMREKRGASGTDVLGGR